MIRKVLVSVGVMLVSFAMGQYKAQLVDEQPFIQNSFVALKNGLFYVTGATSNGVFDVKYVESGKTPITISSGLWDFGSQASAGDEAVFMRASNDAASNPKKISPFICKSNNGGSIVKLHAFDELSDVVIDAPVKVGNKLFYKVGTALRKAQIWVSDVQSADANIAYSINNVDVINSKGNSKYRMVPFNNELFVFTTVDSVRYDVYKTTNLKFDSLTKITNFNTTVSDSMNIMVAGTSKLFMFYKSGTANKLYVYDGSKVDFIGLTANSLGLTDIVTIGDTLYYAANKLVYKVVDKTISQLPFTEGASTTTSINWLRAVGSKLAYIATDSQYGKEPRIYDPNTNKVTVFDVVPGTESWSGITYVVPINGSDYVFYGREGTENRFFVTSGNVVKTIALEGEAVVASGATPVVAGGYVYFSNIKSATRQLFSFNLDGIDVSTERFITKTNLRFNSFDKRLSFDNNNSTVRILVYDISGRTVVDKLTGQNFLDLSQLRKGIYLATINHQTIKFAIN